MSFLLDPLWILTLQDPLLQVWLYDFACSATCATMMNVAAVLVVGIVTLHYWYFKVDVRAERVPESYAYEFAINLLSHTKHGTLEYFTRGFEKTRQARGKETFIAYMPFLPTYIFINDPAVVEHCLKTNFENYVKGPQFYERLVDLLGNAMFS
jgi:hypothetical protein